jgi:hypothetical protein
VPDNRHADAAEVYGLCIDTVGERHQYWHRNDVGAIKRGRDPTGLAVRQIPSGRQIRQQRRPEKSAELHEHLRAANQHDQLLW